MPRNGSGVYSLPSGLPANGDTSDADEDLRVPLEDVATDLNTPRPILAGGTGADNAIFARKNLGLNSFKDVATLLANTSLSYSGSNAVSSGDIITTQLEGAVYQVASSTATDHAVTTAGAVKLYERVARDGYESRADFVAANTAIAGLGLADGQVVSAGGYEYRRLSASTAISDLAGWVPNGLATPFHFGAVGDGVADDRPAFVAMNSYGGDVLIPAPPARWNVSSGVTISASTPQYDLFTTWANLTDGGLIDTSFAEFRDEGVLPILRQPGRSFFGAAAEHSGNRFGANGYGDDPISQSMVSYPIKNTALAAMSVSPQGRTGVLGATWVQSGNSGSTACGLFGYALHEGNGGGARGLYAEGVNASGTAGVAAGAAEFQVGNRTAFTPVVSAYDMANSVINGMQIGAESQHAYTVGDADTVFPAATLPSGAAIDISGGSISSAAQKWTAGMVFRNGALVRDGSSFASALVMAQKHKFVWEVTTSTEGASIWSEVSAGASRMAQAFRNDEVTFYGPTGQTIAAIRHDTAGAGTVNNLVLRSSRTNSPLAVLAEGSDTNVAVQVQSKGTGIIRFMSHNGAGEHLRILNTNVGTDYVTVLGSAGLGTVSIGAAGASTNIDVVFSPKGTGRVRFGTFTGTADVPITGYIEIRDAGGTTRRLAVVA